MNITIIGAGGRMGSWFTRYFYMRGHNLYLNDIDMDALQALSSSISILDKGVAGGRGGYERITIVNLSILDYLKRGKNSYTSLPSSAPSPSSTSIANATVNATAILSNSDLVMLSLPMDTIPKAISRIARYMHRGSMLVEISSLKHDVHRALRYAAERYGVKPLSIHPLFGPGADINVPNRFVLIPVMDREEEEVAARGIFPNATLIMVDDPDEHDRAMALILGMVYAMNISFADLLRDCRDVELCKALAGSTFTLQSLIFEGILNDDPKLFSSLLMNRHVKRYLKRFIASNEHLLACIEERDRDALERVYSKVRDKIASCIDIEGSYRLMYKVLKEISGREG